MYFVYALYSKEFDQIYIGMSINTERRLKEHNSGTNKSTKAYCPWEKLFEESYETRLEARNREKYYKTYRGRVKIREMIKELDNSRTDNTA